MAYTKQTWQDLPSKTTPINASRLGHIEDGIYDAAATADSAASAISNLGSAATKDSTSAITEDSTDLVESGAVYKALEDKVDKTDIAQTLSSAVAPTGGLKSGEQFYLNGSLYTATTTISQGSAIVVYPTAGYNCKLSDSVTVQIAEQKQLLEDTVGWTDDNLITYMNSVTNHDVEYTYNTLNKSVTISGTSNGTSYQQTDIDNRYIDYPKVPKGIYEITAPTVSGLIFQIYTYNTDGTGKTVAIDTRSKPTIKRFKLTEESYVVPLFVVANGTTIDGIYKPVISHISVDDELQEKVDNSVIGTVEDGATASQAYAVNDVFIRNGKLGKCTQPISNGGTFTLNTNYVETTVGEILTALLNA